MKITLKQAAKLIKEVSGYHLDRDSLRNQINKGGWTYAVHRIETPSHFLVEESDALLYAKTFTGTKNGRPKKLH